MKRITNLRLPLLLILVHLLMGFILPSYRLVMIIYLFTFFAGLSLHSLITPSFLRIRFAYFVTIPVCGLIIISILGAYFISFDVTIKLLPLVVLSITCLLLLIQLISSRQSFVAQFTGLEGDFTLALRAYTFIVMPVILLMLLPVLFIEHPTSVFRIGPDMALYAKTTQYFLDGSTWTEAAQRANEYVGMTAGEINRYSDATMSWPIMYYFRWGLTAYQSCVAAVTFTNHAFETAFISLIVPYLLLAGFVLIWLKKQFNLGVTASVLGAIAFAFNANVLNLWFEGFYGNSFTLVFFVPIVYIFIYHRSTNISKQDLTKSLGLVALLLAASLCSYAEGVIFVLPVFIVFIFIFDFVFYTGVIKWSAYILLAVGGVISLLIVLPCDFFLDWLSIAFKQITEEGGNGYNQPYLAWPSEILGFQNIYFNTSVDLVNIVLKRSWVNISLTITISLFVYYLIAQYFKKNDNVGNILFGASIVMVAFSAWYVIYKSPLNNYAYMKMYIFHLPFLFILFWGSLSLFVKDHIAKFAETYKTSLYLIVFIPIVLSGFTYVLQFREGEKLIEKKIFVLHEEAKKLNLSKIVLYPSLISERPQLDLYDKIIFSAVLPAIWMIPSKWTERCITNFKDYKLYLFIEKREGLEFPDLTKNIVYEDDSYLIIDSGYKVGDGVNSESGSLDPRMFIQELNAQLWAYKEVHNSKMGLPVDFNPTTYLSLHPGLQEFWISKGIHENGKALMNRAEIHYRDFGSKEKLEYKRSEKGADDLLVFEK